MTLISVRNTLAQELETSGVNDYEIRRVINQNEQTKEEYISLVHELGFTFKKQIKDE